MSAFARLHPHLQHAIVHDLGWRSLRPVQELTTDALLDGCNAVVLAPTAGGKTEAAIFPLLSRILSEALEPVSVLYVCPIRALLNNQEERLRSYARMVGLDVFKWHGDVGDTKKATFRARPAHLLMTTPESLEVMMISARTDARALFAPLAAVVIDEVHAFAGDDRGAHLAALLERLVAMGEQDPQRIGLSATVGNPLVIGEWLQGSSRRPFRLIDPPREAPRRELHIDFCADIASAANAMARLACGKKSLVFVESRSKAEGVAQALGGSGVEVFIHHSSVSRAERVLAEEQFTRGENTAIVCTSTMELGIDVGDLDQVMQLDAPSSVASFLQRLGRSGRRAGTASRCTFFCLSPESLLQSVALLRLAEAGWVEDVRPAAQAMHVLAHQVMALSLQEGGISRHRLLPSLEAAYPFAGVRHEELAELLKTMLERDILYESDGLLSLGEQGEKLYGRRHFYELYAVFTAPPMLRVQHGKVDVGHLQSLFVSMHDFKQERLCFRLAGRAWEVQTIEWTKGVLHVQPADKGRLPSWLGQPGTLPGRLCQTMKEVLLAASGQESKWLSRGAALELAELRESYHGLLEEGSAPLEVQPEGVAWHTFAGGAVNRLLAYGLERGTGKKWVAGNLSLRGKEVAAAEASEALKLLRGFDWAQLATEAAGSMARGALSKFQPCLPKEAEAKFLAERMLDLGGTLSFLASVQTSASPVALGPHSRRLEKREDSGLPAVIAGLWPSGSPGFAAVQNEVDWVATAAALAAACEVLSSKELIGLDVETALDFGTLCLIQVATEERTYLIDPFTVGSLDQLGLLFASSKPRKIIHNARFEKRILAIVGIELNGVVDTLEISRRLRGKEALGGHSLAVVCERELGLKLDKRAQTSAWARRPLSEEQIRYAALDAEILLSLFRRLAEEETTLF